MRYFLLILLGFVSALHVQAQPAKKKAPASTQPDVNKMMEEAMKSENMSEADKKQMREMMKGISPQLEKLNQETAAYREFTSNKQLIPKRDAARIAAIPRKPLTQAGIPAYVSNLYTKLLAKGKPAEISLAKELMTKLKSGSDLNSAAVLAMQQGHPEAAMALALKAVQTDPLNSNFQNNAAALLTEYGYPEVALPMLQKLELEQPFNSTVLTNMAQAWLGLGETDSTMRFAGRAMKSNPSNSEAMQCGGLMEELQGDPQKAAQHYEDAYADAPNEMSKQMLEHGGKTSDKIDFEKIKRNIAIKEYIRRDYLGKLPVFRGSGNFEENSAKSQGYNEMTHTFSAKVTASAEDVMKDMTALASEGSDKFVTSLGNEIFEGMSFMTKPAIGVMNILNSYKEQWLADYATDVTAFTQSLEPYKTKLQEVLDKPMPPEKCGVKDQAIDEYMSDVNPKIHDFFLGKAEEFRQFTNAWCTWNWYPAGNIHNTVIVQDLGMTTALVGIYSSAVLGQEVLNSYCKPAQMPEPMFIQEPAFPSFACPAVVSIPSGKDFQDLTNASRNFDANELKMTAGKAPVPNASVHYGIGDMISQPGSTPGIKLANGSVTPTGIVQGDPSNPFTAKRTPGRAKLNLPEAARSSVAKQTLARMMSAACTTVKKKKKLPRFYVSGGTLEFIDEEPVTKKDFFVVSGTLEFVEEIPEWHVTGGTLEMDEEPTPFKIGTVPMGKDAEAGTRYVTGEGTLEIYDVDGVPIVEPPIQLTESEKSAIVSEVKSALQQLEATGLQPTITAGTQVPGNFTATAGLFR